MALLRAHYLASAGTAAAITGALLHYPFLVVAVSGFAAMTTDKIIDAFGHSNNGAVHARTPTTHSITTAPIWALLVALAATLVAATLSSWLPFLEQLQPATAALPIVAACQAAALIHLLLDSLTCKGIYVPTMRSTASNKNGHDNGAGGKGGHYRRWGLAHQNYNAPAPTLLALLIGGAGAYTYLKSPTTQQPLASALSPLTTPWSLLIGTITNPWTIPNIIPQLATPLTGQPATTTTPAPTTIGLPAPQGIPAIDQMLSTIYGILSIQSIKWPVIIMLAAIAAVELVPRILTRQEPADPHQTPDNGDEKENEDWSQNENESAEETWTRDREDREDEQENPDRNPRAPPRLRLAQPAAQQQRRHPLPTRSIKLRMLCDKCGSPQTEPPAKYCDKCGAPSTATADTTGRKHPPPTVTMRPATATSPTATAGSTTAAATTTATPPAIFCVMCGKRHTLQEKYCDQCGEQLDKSALPAARTGKEE